MKKLCAIMLILSLFVCIAYSAVADSTWESYCEEGYGYWWAHANYWRDDVSHWAYAEANLGSQGKNAAANKWAKAQAKGTTKASCSTAKGTGNCPY